MLNAHRHFQWKGPFKSHDIIIIITIIYFNTKWVLHGDNGTTIR
jgi:hypothetical protein